MGKNIKDYILNKLFFPKVATIDKPGMIYNVISKRYGRGHSKKRIVFHFEDIIANLQLETIKELGKEKTEELWHKIGKDVGTRYMLLSKAKKPPSFLMPTVIRYIFESYRAAGMSLCENIIYDHKEKSLILKGKNSLICRKTKIGTINTGLVSSVLSFFLKENIETETKCSNCPQNCHIKSIKKEKSQYVEDTKDLMPLANLTKLNFPDKSFHGKEDFKSYSTLLKFGKISIGESGKQEFIGKTIAPAPFEFTELISHNYQKINAKAILKEGVKREAENLFRDLTKNQTKLIDKFNMFNTICTGFGWGLPYCKRNKNELTLTLVCPPISKFGFAFNIYTLNGFLNAIFKRTEVNLKKAFLKKGKIPSLEITYTLTPKPA
jgi:hypothetical protein